MKQRLVGTIVIGSLAVILVPLLLDGEGLSPPPMTTSMPPPPPLPEIPEIEPVRPEITLDDMDYEAPVMESQDLDTEDQPRLNEQGIPEAWTVRLGIFEELANVEALVNRLRESGYKGYSRPLDENQGTLTGVYAGPLLTRSEAESLRLELAESLGLEGLVEQFTIEELSE